MASIARWQILPCLPHILLFPLYSFKWFCPLHLPASWRLRLRWGMINYRMSQDILSPTWLTQRHFSGTLLVSRKTVYPAVSSSLGTDWTILYPYRRFQRRVCTVLRFSARRFCLGIHQISFKSIGFTTTKLPLQTDKLTIYPLWFSIFSGTNISSLFNLNGTWCGKDVRCCDTDGDLFNIQQARGNTIGALDESRPRWLGTVQIQPHRRAVQTLSLNFKAKFNFNYSTVQLLNLHLDPTA